MADKYFRLRRKQDGFTTEPLTAEQASGIADYPGDFEKVPLGPGQSAYLEGATTVTGEPVARKERKPRVAAKPPARRVQARGASTPAETPAEAKEIEAAADPTNDEG